MQGSRILARDNASGLDTVCKVTAGKVGLAKARQGLVQTAKLPSLVSIPAVRIFCISPFFRQTP